MALSKDRYRVHAMPHVDWKGTRYWIGMSLKFTAWIRGHTFQLANRAAGGQRGVRAAHWHAGRGPSFDSRQYI